MQEGEKINFQDRNPFQHQAGLLKSFVLDGRHFQEPPTLRLCFIIALFPSIVVKEGEIICQFLSAEKELLLKCNHRVFVCTSSLLWTTRHKMIIFINATLFPYWGIIALHWSRRIAIIPSSLIIQTHFTIV